MTFANRYTVRKPNYKTSREYYQKLCCLFDFKKPEYVGYTQSWLYLPKIGYT